jgi:hypothetical protein
MANGGTTLLYRMATGLSSRDNGKHIWRYSELYVLISHQFGAVPSLPYGVSDPQ